MNLHLTEHFKLTEPGLACPCCGRIRLVTEFFTCMDLLEQMRVRLGFPIVFNSGYRCPEHNRRVGGEEHSMHMSFAADIRPAHVSGDGDGVWEAKLHSLWGAAKELGFGGIGIYDTWVHVDTRRGFIARWDNRSRTNAT